MVLMKKVTMTKTMMTKVMNLGDEAPPAEYDARATQNLVKVGAVAAKAVKEIDYDE